MTAADLDDCVAALEPDGPASTVLRVVEELVPILKSAPADAVASGSRSLASHTIGSTKVTVRRLAKTSTAQIVIHSPEVAQITLNDMTVEHPERHDLRRPAKALPLLQRWADTLRVGLAGGRGLEGPLAFQQEAMHWAAAVLTARGVEPTGSLDLARLFLSWPSRRAHARASATVGGPDQSVARLIEQALVESDQLDAFGTTAEVVQKSGLSLTMRQMQTFGFVENVDPIDAMRTIGRSRLKISEPA